MRITILKVTKTSRNVKSGLKDEIIINSKVYKRIIQYNTHTKKYKPYYVNEKDWQNVAPIIKEFIIQTNKEMYDNLKTVERKYSELRKDWCNINNTWYCKFGKFLNKIKRFG